MREDRPSSTATLIAADKVEGTNVYNRLGEHLGSIDNIMIDKLSGKVAYAVMSFGGFLGIGGTLVSKDEQAALDRLSAALA